MKIIRALQQAGHKASNPDDRVGYGIPNMKLAFGNLLTDYATATSTLSGCRVTVNWNTKDVAAMKYEIERKAPGEPVFTKVGELTPQAGSVLTNRSYQFNNDLAAGSSGVFSYRVRQILDTAATGFFAVYIDTTTMNIATACTGSGPNPDPDKVKISVQPNPVSGSTVTLVVETPYMVNDMPIAVYNNKGQLLMQLQESKGTGRKDIELNIGKLATGKYYIRVMNGPNVIGVAELLKLQL
jgi:hypothetical protein